MATKIVTKNSSTGGSAPSASDLVQGELAVNVTDGRLYTENASAAIVELGVNPTAEIQANAGVAFPTTQKAEFRDSAIYINSSADGQLDIVADTEIQIAATTVDINGNADVSGTLGVGGSLTVGSNLSVISSDTYAVFKIRTDANDDGSNDDGIIQITNGSSDVVKAELRWDESTNTVELGHGDNQGHLVINSSGNVGIGSVPDAWASGYTAIDVGSAGSVWGTTAGATLTAISDNTFFDGGSYVAKNTGLGSMYFQNLGAHHWRSFPSVSAGADQTASDKMQLNSAGNLIIGGGVTLGNGQTYAAANTISDYEEGTWTPALNRVSASTVSYTNRYGYYTKVGRLVTLNFYITINAVAAQGGSVNYISGLPFTGGGVNLISNAGSLGINTGFATAVSVTTMQRGSEASITFHQATNNAANLGVNWVAGGVLSGTISYHVD